MKEVIFYLIFAILSQIISYKIVRKIDKKERKFLKQWELEYINAYKDLWKKSYFEKLAEERKIKLYEEELKHEKEQTKKALNEVIIDEEFREEYNNNLKVAIEELEAKEN